MESGMSMGSQEIKGAGGISRSELWFDDGSVILQAESTQFRVHRSMLARHSIIFADMFSIPQPAPEQQLTIEGCLIVELSDSAQDVELILRVLYDNLKIYDFSEAIPSSVVAAMLRLGRKYEIHHLRDEALRRLSREYPTDTVDKYWQTLLNNSISEVNLIDMAALAWENSAQVILPILFYECASLPMKDLLNGILRADGSMAQLPDEILRICLMGREEIIAALPSRTFAFLDDARVVPCVNCPSVNQCTTARMKLAYELWKPMPPFAHCIEQWDDDLSDGFCKSCSAAAEDAFREGREKMFSDLPSFFGLPPWKELRNCGLE